MRKPFVRLLPPFFARHRAATTIALSLVAHGLLAALLMLRLHPSSPPIVTEMTLLDPASPAPGPPGDSTGAAAATALPQAPRSRSRASHGHRPHSPVPLAPAPASAAEPAPVADVPPPPDDDERAIGDDRPDDDRDPGDDHDGDGIGAVAGSGNGSGSGNGGNGRGGNGHGNGADLSREPDVNFESCVHGLHYPWRAELLYKEGVVHLRVVLDAAGHVRDAQVRQKAGYGFDEAAVESLLRRCRFTSALDPRGRPIAYVIEDYRFHFILADFQK